MYSITTKQTDIFTDVFIIFVDKLPPPPPVNNNIAAATRLYIYISVSLYYTVAGAAATAVGR